MSLLQRAITDLRGVGPHLAKRLANLQIFNFQDILFHLPYRYVDRTRIHPLRTVKIDDLVEIEVTVTKSSVIPKPKRNLVVNVQDPSGKAELRFFHFNAMQQEQFEPGVKVRCFGQARLSRNGLQFIHPEYRIVPEGAILPVEEYLTPIYPVTEGVSQKLLRNLVQQVLKLLDPIQNSLEILPTELLQELQFMPLMQALQQLHFPTPEFYKEVLNTEVFPAQRRLAFEELLAQHLSLRQKRQRQMRLCAEPIITTNALSQRLLAMLPFQLTHAQQNAINIVQHDLAQSYPMMRLVQGDVGSGKTLVAVMAALQVIEAGFQVAFMAPTEILIEQHYQNIKQWCDQLGIKIACLTGKLNAREKQNINTAVKENAVQLLLGTHAIFQDTVEFEKLALVIIDEQHRFGVGQRLALHNKGMQEKHCHQLILTATPIPRTLAMTFYADLDYAVIDELPPGRKPITTLLVSSERRNEVFIKIASICEQGQQVYWVCTLIEESEVIDCTPAELALQELQQELPNFKVALIHGKMHSRDKEQIMHNFKSGNIDILVATTVIEVGVDVPNASLMVIENPERLGLAQLHQLRGRVGRGALQSYCILLYKKPLGERAAQRLQFMRDSQDGFALAEFDLKLRGPGEVFGTKQSGLANLRIADLIRDKDLLPKVFAAAEMLSSKYPHVVSALIKRWLREQVQYAVV